MFTKISQSAFNELQVDAGILLNSFNPASPAEPTDAQIITATTGGITVNCTPTYSDWGSDVDNCPPNMKELKHLDGWDCNIQTTALGTSPELIRLALGAADIDSNDETKIVPRRKLKQSDFESSLWWVGDKADGGLVAIELKNALSTAGFSLKTTKDGKGNISLTITGHVSINDQDTMPMVFYATEGETLDDLTVSSVAGTTTGKTALTVSGHTLATGESYVYKIGTAAEDVELDDVLSTGWTAWTTGTEITATAGQKITVAVVDSSNKAKAVGSATIVVNAGT